jgi:small-conductance mechanosensitive channel
MRWVIGIVVVAVLVVLGYQYFGPGSEQIAEQPEQPAEPATETAEPAETTEPEPAEQAAETAEQATEEAAQATGEAAETAEQAADTAETAEQATGEAAEELAQSSAALVVGDIDLGKELTGVVDRTSAALSGITDAASAEAALPALNEARTKLDDLTPTVEQLPEDAKATLASAVGGMLPELRTLVDQVNGIEGVGEVVKPAVEPIMAKLDAWAKQPA